ncbi:MAG: hypothetical protein HKN47_01415 [Pirellulaceae bacterium]|nr:hypothetical protein [Pirellulaceae bacterium]
MNPLSNDPPESPDPAGEAPPVANPESHDHTGYDLEAGLLARVREWNDVLPWLRLGRTLRVAASLPLLFLVAMTFALWCAGNVIIAGDNATLERLVTPRAAVAYSGTDIQRHTVNTIGQYAKQMIPTTIFEPLANDDGLWRTIAAILWALVIWMPATLMLLRQGALLTAGRNMTAYVPGLTHAAQTSPLAWLMAVVPLGCVVVIALGILLVGWMSQLGVWLEVPLAIVAALIALPCGILAFGANFAVPLGWAALANEKDPDALDSLSRGYEYVYRRPLQLTFYFFITMVLLLVVIFFANGVAIAATYVSQAMLQTTGASLRVQQTSRGVLQLLPTIVALTLFWSLVGGVYLLLRRDAGGQEVEDIWQPPPQTVEPLPKLPS